MKFNYWKVIVIVAIAVCIFLFGRSCGIGSVVKTEYRDTLIKLDTINHIDTLPVPIKVIIPQKPINDTQYLDGQPYPVYIPCYEDTIHDWYFTRIYKDTSVMGLTIFDTVHKNRIIGKNISLIRNDSFVVKTTIITPPQRLVVYLDLSANLNSVYSGLSLKTKKDFIFGGGIRLSTNKTYTPELKFSLPIKLKRDAYKP